jgi:hypothetical protein
MMKKKRRDDLTCSLGSSVGLRWQWGLAGVQMQGPGVISVERWVIKGEK